MIDRKKTKKIKIGDRFVGGDSPVLIQSMTNTKTYDIKNTLKQILNLENKGCEAVRVSVPDEKSAIALKEIKKKISIPLIADIHFDYKMAIESIKNGADAIRINPGNIGNEDRIKEIVYIAKKNNVSIRVGVNLGSLEKEIYSQYGKTSQAMVESAKKNVEILEKFDFDNIVVSLKSSDLLKTVKAYKMFSNVSEYPLHIGITEAGTVKTGSVKSSIGIGSLLLSGIGDTIRVSLTSDPVEEIEIAKLILKSIGYYKGVQIISCPTCSRTNIDLIPLTNKIENLLKDCDKNIKVAVMGCSVNGPGEASDADVGVAAGKNEALLFVKGKIIGKYPEDEILDKLMFQINLL